MRLEYVTETAPRVLDLSDVEADMLTAAGKRLVPQLSKLADANDEEFFACLTPRERTALLDTLKKLVKLNQLSTLPVD